MMMIRMIILIIMIVIMMMKVVSVAVDISRFCACVNAMMIRGRWSVQILARMNIIYDVKDEADGGSGDGSSVVCDGVDFMSNMR